MGLASKVNAAGPGGQGPPASLRPTGPRPEGGPPMGGPPPNASFQGGAPGGYPPAQGGPPQGGFPGQQPQQQQGGPGGYPPQGGNFNARPPPPQQAGSFVGGRPPGGYNQHQGPQAGFPPQGPPQGGNAGFVGTHGLMGPPGSAGAVMPVVQQKLQNMVRSNRLEAFFPQGLGRVFDRLDRVNFQALSQKWSMPLELATDLSQLALYDIVIFADDSGSMVFEERGERIDDLKLILERVSEVATLFDDDGILVRFMNSGIEGNGIRDASAAQALVQQVQFTGMTPLGSKLNDKVIQPFLFQGIQRRDLAKPILVIVISDGEPVGEPAGTVKRVILQAKHAAMNSPYGPGAIAFQFAQVGKDVKAQRFIGELDNDVDVGTMIDGTSYYELEAEEYARKGIALTPELWLVKLMVGAIDSSYDEQD